ncbi:MAG: hypothetical protein P1P90_06540 [Patescibacteria group bacterium]|nr:hypothetical protein [Patescibacteria group bacterium]
MSRRETKGLMFARIERSIRNFSSPFARGNGRFTDGEDLSKSLIHSVQADFLEVTHEESPIVEGIARAWRLREEDILRNAHPLGALYERIPFEDDEGIEAMADHELRRISCRRGAMEEVGMCFGHVEPPRNRNIRRETLRRIHRLPREEQMFAGENLRSDGEERRARRRARACKRPLAEVLAFPARTSQSADESAAA